MKKLLIWGAGDQGLVTLDCALAMKVYERIAFIEIKERDCREILGYTIYQEEQFDEIIQDYDEVIVATGSNELRETKTKMLLTMNVPLATIIHPSAVISPTAKIKSGSTVLANAIINLNARIGRGCIINNGAIIEHDCQVGDYVNICPKFAMAGHTTIGQRSYMGIGSTIIDEIKVGQGVTVGAGAVVIRDVPDNKLVVGVPAKIKE